MRLDAIALAAVLAAATVTAGQAQEKTVMVGGAAMYPSKDIVDNAVNSKDHTTLVTAVKAAGLVDTLKGPGPFTVFAPTNEAFAKLPAGTVERLLKAENRTQLKAILTYHVVAGNLDTAALADKVKAGGGKAALTTVNGATLWIVREGEALALRDERGATTAMAIADVRQSNGVIHVITSVAMPK